jgi:hypothetical protein
VAIPHGTESEMPNAFQSKGILAESMLLKGDRLADMKESVIRVAQWRPPILLN